MSFSDGGVNLALSVFLDLYWSSDHIDGGFGASHLPVNRQLRKLFRVLSITVQI